MKIFTFKFLLILSFACNGQNHKIRFKRSQDLNGQVVFSINHGYNPSIIDTLKYIKLYDKLINNLENKLNNGLYESIKKINSDSIVVNQPMIFIDSDDVSIYLVIPFDFYSDQQKSDYKITKMDLWIYSNSLGLYFKDSGEILIDENKLNWMY